MGNWKTCQLGDLITFQRGHDLPKAKMSGGAYPVVGSNGIIGYHDEYTTENPSITIGRSGNVGKPFLIKGRSWSHNTSLYIREYKDVDPFFIYYFLQTLDLGNYAGGSAVPTLNRNHIHTLSVTVPVDITEQRQIASILSVLDDKIENNTEINENLLQQASTIYQAWFEDFIPFGGIFPTEWGHGVLSDIADITSGKRPPMKSAEKTDIAMVPLVGAASVMGFTREANHADKILVTGRVGTHGIVQRFNTPCWTSDNTLVITSDFYEYTYQILQRIDYHAINRGSTQPLITQGDMNKVTILIPDRQTLDDFEALVGQLMLQYEANLLENTKLAELRDTLLPRLMSGELDISGVDL